MKPLRIKEGAGKETCLLGGTIPVRNLKNEIKNKYQDSFMMLFYGISKNSNDCFIKEEPMSSFSMNLHNQMSRLIHPVWDRLR